MIERRLQYLSAVVVAGAMAVGAALIQGRITHRWDTTGDVRTGAVDLVRRLPQQFGDWEMLENAKLDEATIQLLQCTEYAHRIYANRKSGDRIMLTLLLGPSGPLTVHAPEVCFASRGAYEAIGIPDRITLVGDEAPSRFYYSRFRPDARAGAATGGPVLPPIEVFYGWSTLRGWEAPDAPRFAFGGEPLLFKLTVVSQLWPNVAAGENGMAAKFILELLRAMPKDFQSARNPASSA